MAESYQRIEVMTIGTARARFCSAEQKPRITEESLAPRKTISPGRSGVAPNLPYRWRLLMRNGSTTAVGSDEPAVSSSEVRKLEERLRELKRLFARETMETEILRDALAKAQVKKPMLRPLSLPRDGIR